MAGVAVIEKCEYGIPPERGVCRREPVTDEVTSGAWRIAPHTPSRRRFASRKKDSALFDGDRFRQVARLVSVFPHEDGRVIGEKLHRHRIDDRREGRLHGGHDDRGL